MEAVIFRQGLVNDGVVNIDGWEGFLNLDGEIVNRGASHICGDPMNLNGTFRNEGEVEIHWGILSIGGEFDNRGRVYTYNREGVGFQGNWIGEGIDYQ